MIKTKPDITSLSAFERQHEQRGQERKGFHNRWKENVMSLQISITKKHNKPHTLSRTYTTTPVTLSLCPVKSNEADIKGQHWCLRYTFRATC